MLNTIHNDIGQRCDNHDLVSFGGVLKSLQNTVLIGMAKILPINATDVQGYNDYRHTYRY